MSLKKYLCSRKFFIVCFCLGLVVISAGISATYFLFLHYLVMHDFFTTATTKQIINRKSEIKNNPNFVRVLND